MKAPRFIRRLFKMRHENDSLPSLEAGEAAARAADMPWLGKGAREEFSGFPGAQGGFGDKRASLRVKQHQRILINH